MTKVEIVVLGLLAEEPMHGYEMLERLRGLSPGLGARIGRASVYQTLARLAAAGSIASARRPGAGGPARTVYRTTRVGRTRLGAALAGQLEESGPYETGGGLALGFAHLLGPEDARRAVAARERAVTALIEQVRARRQRPSAGEAHAAVRVALLDRQEALARAELGWLRRFRTAIASSSARDSRTGRPAPTVSL